MHVRHRVVGILAVEMVVSSYGCGIPTVCQFSGNGGGVRRVVRAMSIVAQARQHGLSAPTFAQRRSPYNDLAF